MDARKLKRIVQGLDPNNDEHWTGAGKPSVEAVRREANDQNISRDDLTNAVGDYNRETARAGNGGAQQEQQEQQQGGEIDMPESYGEASDQAGLNPATGGTMLPGEQQDATKDELGRDATPKGGDPALSNEAGLRERPMESTAERDVRAATTANHPVARERLKKAQEEADRMAEGEDPAELMDKLCAITSSPLYQHNQTFTEIRRLWAVQGQTARDDQLRLKARKERLEQAQQIAQKAQQKRQQQEQQEFA